MHDNVFNINYDSTVFLIGAFFIFTFHSQFIIRKLYQTLVAIALALYFTDSWDRWEFYLAAGLGTIFGWINTNLSKRPYKRPNSVETIYYLVILPFYTIGFMPLVVPQTGVAYGVVLALMVWCFLAVVFHNFYKKHKRTLDPYAVVFVLAVFLIIFIFHRWRWACVGTIIGTEALIVGYHVFNFVL